MRKKHYLPFSAPERVIWLNNLAAKIGGYATKYGLTTAEVDAIVAMALFYSYWVNLAEQAKTFREDITKFIGTLSIAPAGTVLGTPPAFSPAAAPPSTDAGIFTFISGIVQRIKATVGYSENDGEDLGIIGDAMTHLQVVAGFYEQSGKISETLDTLRRIIELDQENAKLEAVLASSRDRSSIDTAAAKAMRGVVEIFTGKDTADAKMGGLICGWVVKDKHGQPHKAPPHPVMALDTVRYVGDTVAMVVANTADEAKDAAEAIKVDYVEKPANVDLAKALNGAPDIHAEAPGNLIYDWEIGVKADVDAAFSKAAHVTKIDIVNNRLIPNAMEPRAAASDYDKGTGNYTLWSTSQNPHVLRLILSAFVLAIPEHKLRVIAPDVGGGFGSKIFCYNEETMLTWAAPRVEIGRAHV